MARRGHQVVFFERDVQWYAASRDLTELPGGTLRLYSDWTDVAAEARRHCSDADVAMVTSYCPDGVPASRMMLDSPVPLRVFYDLDTPVTLARLQAGETVDYLGPAGLADFDLALSYTGGAALDELQSRLGARRVAPLYGSVDPEVHKPAPPIPHYRGDLSYLGTYAEDRQSALNALFVEPARRLPEQKFILGGAQYPQAFPWTKNIYFVRHLEPEKHPAFYCSSRLTLNITRRAMADMGYCPSGRLFEAAACGAPILSDWWEGLDAFFEPDKEILIARTSEDTIAALSRSDAELARIAQAARERVLMEHTADRRAEDLETALNDASAPAARQKLDA